MNSTSYTNIEIALDLIKEMGVEAYFEIFPDTDLELAIADILRKQEG